MSSARDQPPWDVCRDGIDRIADRLLEIFRDWPVRHLGHFRPADLEDIYERAEIEFIMVWLEIHVSVDFAKRLKAKLAAPLDALTRWYDRLDQQQFESLSEMNAPYLAIQWRLWRTVRYLRAASVVLQAREGGRPVRCGEVSYPLWKHARLAPLEHDLVETIRSAGGRLNLSSMLQQLAARGKRAVEREAKEALASLVQHKIISIRYDTDPPGYGLPEWG